MNGPGTIESSLGPWIGEGPDLAPQDLLADVLDSVDLTPQRHRRRWLMHAPSIGVRGGPTPRFVLAVAVITAVFVGVLRLASSLPLNPAPGISSSPSISPAENLPALPPGRLEPGSYRMVPVGAKGPEMALTIPPGWESCCEAVPHAVLKGAETDPGMASLSYWSVDTVYSDPCGHAALRPAVGPTVADLAAAIARLPGTDATRPVRAFLAGREATYLELTLRDDIPCSARAFDLWAVGRALRYAQAAGELDRLWILDVGGQRVAIDAVTLPGTSAASRAELHRIVDSIRFLGATGD
jgi:hypothetical protein